MAGQRTLSILLLGATYGMGAFALPPARVGIQLAIKVNHFGYRPGDPKIAVVTADPGTVAELRRASDNALLFTVPAQGGSITSKGKDAQAGDSVWHVDFSPLTTAGTYRLVLPGLGGQSYDFEIGDSVYNKLAATVLKAMYAQRCGVSHPAAYMGENWADPEVCHPQDKTCTRNIWDQGAGTDYGALDLSGFWHDAGDYNKYLEGGDRGDAVWYMATAYDLKPGVFTDGQLKIPESGNGVPDILDEIRWGLDWYQKVQRADGSALSVVHAKNGDFSSASPPSKDTTPRYYKDATVDSTAAAGACLALGARLWGKLDPAYAARLRSAAERAWGWLAGKGAESKLWAAAELFRLDPTGPKAPECKAYIDGFATWANAWGMWSEGCTFGKNCGTFMVRAMVAYAQASSATPEVVAGMKAQFAELVKSSFSIAGPYGSGLTEWEYYWSSNRAKATRGLLLVVAAKLGATASFTPQAVRAQALWYLHYLCGVNALNMVYVTNTASIGGEHCVWRIFHQWFPYGSTKYYGKPASVQEPAYPYFSGTDALGIRDDVSSAYGPFPGFVPDGPNKDYTGSVGPPKGAAAGHRFYRDWAYSDPSGKGSVPWEVNETGIYYITSFAALAGQFISGTEAPPSRPGVPDRLK
jgi:hypothetical protein